MAVTSEAKKLMPVGRQVVIADEVCEAPYMGGPVTDRGGEDRRSKNSNAIGPEVLKKPWNRGEDGGPQIGFVEQREKALPRSGGGHRGRLRPLRPRTSSQWALSVIEKRPIVTIKAGMTAVAYI
jgi:hypothetical protein